MEDGPDRSAPLPSLGLLGPKRPLPRIPVPPPSGTARAWDGHAFIPPAPRTHFIPLHSSSPPWQDHGDIPRPEGENLKDRLLMTKVVASSQGLSRTWTYFQGEWLEGNAAIMGARTHAAWLGSAVFDGARRFEGTMPDLDMHCARVNRSAVHLGLNPVVSEETWLGLVHEGVRFFDANAALYIRPMYWPEGGSGGGVMFDPESTQWCLCLYEAPMPPTTGAAITLSPFRKPSAPSAPVEAKASCLYPNNSRALIEAARRGFSNCLLLDAEGQVAELANANVFMVKNGVVYTPSPTGVFLNGITRRRVIGLLRDQGVEVVETALAYEDFLDADEIFSCGNFQKVAPVVQIDARAMQQGPIYRKARALYWEFAHAGS